MHERGKHTTGKRAGRVKGYAAHIRVRYVKCGKGKKGQPCGGCPHGPYRYKVWRDADGRVREKYLGRAEEGESDE